MIPTEPNTDPIRVFIVDDQAMIRAAFKSLLARTQGFEVVGDCGDPLAAVAAARAASPDVILLDITMPGLSGIDLVPRLRAVLPRVHVVMLTHHEGESFVDQALRAGAEGYLSKDSDPAELVLALESVHKGRMFLSPKVAAGMLQRARTGAQPVGGTRLESLTPREREVFQLLALGKSNKEVAHALSITLGTAKKHRENLQRKLDCHSAAEMAILAIQEGLLEA
ncbi:MAG: response regulator transcription factor [Planctomycetes bacterium]|nr:response regulator transcription factor [Planctomycetota bacterium]